ncbi:MAG: RHS repeat-associated core domain-containing protein [Candidatus Coproplasma sp.]
MVKYVYDAWGNCLVTGDSALSNANPFRYRGYYYDTQTGLYYLQTRYYDPTTGRFISPDNIDYADPETVDGLNLYAYCGNNPVMNVDPTGTSIIGLLITLGVLVAGAAIGGGIIGKKAYDQGVRGWDLVGQIVLGASMGLVVASTIVIEEEIERDLLNRGAYTELQIKALLEYHRYLRTGKCDSFADVFVYDFLLSMPQEMQIRYLFIFRGQGELIKFCFLWIYEYFNGNGQQNVIAREVLSKYSYQLYKKHAVKLQPWAKQLFIEVELEAEELIKRYGIKDSRPNEKFVKAVQKAATAKGMTVAEYRDKILFPHGKERIIERFKKFIKLHPEMQGKFKPQTKANVSAQNTRASLVKRGRFRRGGKYFH